MCDEWKAVDGGGEGLARRADARREDNPISLVFMLASIGIILFAMIRPPDSHFRLDFRIGTK